MTGTNAKLNDNVVKAVKIIFINLVTVTILLVLINWACGWYLKKTDILTSRHELPNYKDDPDYAKTIFNDYSSLDHQYEPFVGWKCLPYKGKTLHISENGERIHPSPDIVQPSKTIHFFGGSTMWGEGSDDNHTIPALFNKHNPDYEVVNHGQLAYNTRQELDALITLYSKGINPDVVIFYDGVNDAAFLCPSEIKQLPAHRLVPMYRNKLYSGKTAVVTELVTKIFFENILKVIRKFTVKESDHELLYDCLRTPGKAEEIAEIMMKNWELANELVTKRGGNFIAILQPAAFIGNPRVDHLKLDKELGKNFVEVYRHIKLKIAQRKYPWIYDLSDSFDGDEYVFIDFCHVSPNGNEIIAKEITNIATREISTVVSNVQE